VVQGDNAQGKTSLLEAIHMLATGRGIDGTAGRTLIRWGSESEAPYPYALLRTLVQRRDGERLLELILHKDEHDRLRKEVRVDHVVQRTKVLSGQLMTVLFLPGDVTLASGAPSLRREFLDEALTQVDSEYGHALEKYTYALAQRNALLRQAAESGRSIDADELELWDEQLVTSGVSLILGRYHAIHEMTSIAEQAHLALSDKRERLHLVYQPSVKSQPQAQAALTEAFYNALRARRREEILRGMTLVGPHRDELRLLVNGMDVGEYGSRGQQRTAVLALKLAQAEWMHQRCSESPVLLLDEVFAELDPHRRRCLLERIRAYKQVFITTTDMGRLEQSLVTDAQRFIVRSGVLQPS
ncbi:MAG: DNA replication/repair protein RecF, partial [Candidatus Methanomethylicaceae archaeon]